MGPRSKPGQPFQYLLTFLAQFHRGAVIGVLFGRQPNCPKRDGLDVRVLHARRNSHGPPKTDLFAHVDRRG